MEIQISEETMLKLKDISQTFNFNEEEIIEKAITLYLKNLENSVDLKKEMESWESAGIEDLNIFEKKL